MSDDFEEFNLTIPAENHATSEGIPILATKCVECGKSHLIAVHSGLQGEELIQARWCSGLAQLTHGGWMCGACLDAHADRSLQPAAEAVRAGFQRVRIVKGWNAETVRGKR